MRWLAVFFFLLVSTFIAAQNCTPSTKLTNVKKNYDDVGWYSKAMSSIMKGMIGGIRTGTADKIGQIVKDVSQTHSHLMGIVTDHISVTIIFILLLIISIGLLLSLFIVLICRWCSSKTEGLTPSTSQVVCTLVTFLICCGVCATGAFVYFSCLKGVKDGIGDVSVTLNTTTGQISTFVENYYNTITCNEVINNQNLTDFVNRVKLDVDGKMAIFIAKLEEAKGLGQNISKIPGLAAAVPSLGTLVPQLDTELQKIEDAMNGIKSKLHGYIDNANTEIRKAYTTLSKAVKEVRDGFKKVEGRLVQIMGENDNYAATIATVVQYSFVIPLILCALMTFAFIVLIVRFLVNRAQENPEKRGCLSSVGGNVLGVSGYVAMFTGSLLFLLAACIFLVAFASMFFCIGFFDDPDLVVFKAFPALQQKIGNAAIGINAHDAFVRCRNEYPFFDAIDGAKQLASNKLATVTDLIAKTDFGAGFRKFQVPASLLTAVEALKKLQPNNPDIAKYDKELYHLNSRADRDEMLLGIEDALMRTLDELTTMVGYQLETVMDFSPHCDAMNVIWNNVGGFICNGISMPAQGAWMACAICGIASFTVFHWMFKSTRYLKNFENNKLSEEKMAKKKSKDKEKGKENAEDVEDPEAGEESLKKRKSKSGGKDASGKIKTGSANKDANGEVKVADPPADPADRSADPPGDPGDPPASKDANGEVKAADRPASKEASAKNKAAGSGSKENIPNEDKTPRKNNSE